jgi:hypothetical protein
MNTILPEPHIILDPPDVPSIPLPKGWTDHTLLAILHVIALERIVILNVSTGAKARNATVCVCESKMIGCVRRLDYYNVKLKSKMLDLLGVIDHYSSRVMGFDIFEQSPTSSQIVSAMNRICNDNAVKPKYVVSDQGIQFVSAEIQSWCSENEIKQRFGAIGKHGSIVITERAILTYKDIGQGHQLEPTATHHTNLCVMCCRKI